MNQVVKLEIEVWVEVPCDEMDKISDAENPLKELITRMREFNLYVSDVEMDESEVHILPLSVPFSALEHSKELMIIPKEEDTPGLNIGPHEVEIL